MPDPLDAGKPNLKRWEEFRAQYSAALLTHWVFRDLSHEATDAVDDLWSRLQSELLPKVVDWRNEKGGVSFRVTE